MTTALREDSAFDLKNVYHLPGIGEPVAEPATQGAPQSVPDVLLIREPKKRVGRKKGSRNKPKKAKPAPITPPISEAAAAPLPIAAVPGGRSMPNLQSMRQVHFDTIVAIVGGFCILALGFAVGVMLHGSV